MGGGHSAWKKRVRRGGLAKEGGGGAICRHRPHLGPKGKDREKQRKGNIGGGPKKKKRKTKICSENRKMELVANNDTSLTNMMISLFSVAIFLTIGKYSYKMFYTSNT